MRRHVLALLVGIIGFVVAFGGWHLYVDHQALHGLVNMVIQQQQRQQTAEPRPSP